MKTKNLLLFLGLTLLSVNSYSQIKQETTPLTIVLVMDGLRPDAITKEHMPNLYKLQQDGVKYTNSHAAVPTVTRVNSPSLATGFYPETHGIMSNSIFIEDVNPNNSISTGNYKNLIKVDSVSNGKLLYAKSIGEILQKNGLTYVAISSGSSGSAFLLNHTVSKGNGYLVNPGLNNNGFAAIPNNVGQIIKSKFGNPPIKNDNQTYNPSVDWVENILFDYVLPEIKPTVVYNWFTEPDHSQHHFGTGSKEYYNALKNNDKHVGLLVNKLIELDLYNNSNIIVTSDHGMNEDTLSLNLNESCIEAGIDPNDFIIASSGESLLLHVKNHDKTLIKKIVKHLQSQDWVGAIFTEHSKDPDNKDLNPYGFVEGTFSLDLIHGNHPIRRPDIFFNYQWSSNNNEHGISGTSFKNTNGTAKKLGNGGGHGNLSPACINNTLVTWGKDFKSGIQIHNPVGIVDITPTVLNILDINTSIKFDGRVLEEALVNGPDPEKIIIESKTYRVRTNDTNYEASLQISTKENHWYVDKAWRN